MRQAGRRARTRARNARDLFFRKNAALFGAVLGAWTVLASMAIWLTLPWLRPYLIGSSITIGVWLFVAMLNLSNAGRFDAGADAEQWTSKELRRLGPDWRVIDGVEFADGDVDHVLVGPGGVFAVETKWSSYACDLDKGLLSWGIEGGVNQSRASARKISLLLRSQKMLVEVRPVVFVWGPQIENTVRGFVDIGKVRLIRGVKAGSWRTAFQASQIMQEPEIRRAAEICTDYVGMHRPYELQPLSVFSRQRSP